MSASIPPAPPPMPPPAPIAAGNTVVTVSAGAQVLQNLAAGALIDATIAQRPAPTLLQVTTAQGELTLTLPRDALPLPGSGGRLVLQMLNPPGGEPLLRIVSLNGRPILPGGIPLLPGVPPQNPGGPAAPVTGQATAPAAVSAAQSPSAPTALTATLLRPAIQPGTQATPNQATGGLPPNLPPGTTLPVRLAGTLPSPQAPAPGAAPAQAAQAPAATAAPPAALPAGTPAQAGPTMAPQPAAPSVPAPSAVSLPASPGAPPTGSPAAPTLTGTVTAHPPGGQAVVQTPAGTLAVPVPSPLPVGARVVLELAGPPLPPPAPSVATSAPQGLGAGGWPALAETLDTLARADPKLAEQVMNSLPQANARLGATLSVFAAAIRSGDWRQITGDTIRAALEKSGKGELAARLKGDVEKLSADATRPLGGGGEWRAMTLPFLNHEAIEPIRLYLRKPPEDDEGPAGRKGGGDGQRFVIEITMSRLGRIQFDGMVKRDDKQFDLILRTEQPLPAEMRRDIMLIFTGAGELCGTKGVVVFQPGRFIDLPAIETPAPTALVV